MGENPRIAFPALPLVRSVNWEWGEVGWGESGRMGSE